MPRVGVLYEVEGLAHFEATLKQAQGELRTRLERVGRETAMAIARDARARAPHGGPYSRGDLVANITFDGRGLNWKVGILDRTIPRRAQPIPGRRGGGGHSTAHLNPWVYGVWYEYGFVTRQIATTPFMRPAAQAHAADHLARLTAAVTASLAKVA